MLLRSFMQHNHAVVGYLRSRHRYWVHPINLRRVTHGEFHHLMADLRKDDRKFSEYFRMEVASFDKLLEMLKHR